MGSHPMTFVFHYGGNFRNDEGGTLIYEPDNTEVLMGVEEDTLDVFFVKNYYKELRCDNANACLWKVPGISLELGRRKLEFDRDLAEMVRDCRRNNNVINIYFDHGVSKPHVVDCMSEDDDVIVLPKFTSQPNNPQPMENKTHPHTILSQPTKSIPKPNVQPKPKPNVQPNPKPNVQPNPKPNVQPKPKPNAQPKPQPTYQGILTPVQQSRLDALDRLSRNCFPQWSGDANEELYEIDCSEPNMVVDLGKHTCTCRFWQLTGMPCMHAISAIHDKNDKRPEEYCHEWLRMDSYRRTYAFNVNPIKGQDLWEKTESPAPVPPPRKPKPGRPTMNRKKEKDEGPVGSKTRMKRKYNPIRCMWCGEVGHNKRTCNVRKKEEATEKARLMQLQLATAKVDEAAPGKNAEPAPPPAQDNVPTEIVLSQTEEPPATQDSQSALAVITDKVKQRPPKLQVKKGRPTRAISPPPAASSTPPLSAETINGASSATAKKIASLSRFMPTPGFKRPRKKDN